MFQVRFEDPYEHDVAGNDALMMASIFGRTDNVKFWLKQYPDWDLERKNKVMGGVALGQAVYMDPFGPFRTFRTFRTFSDPLGPFRTFRRTLSDISDLFGPFGGPFRTFRTFSDPLGPFRTFQRTFRTFSDPLGPFQTFRRTLLDLSDPFGHLLLTPWHSAPADVC